MHLVRFFKIACHFCKNFAGAYAHVYGKAQFLIYSVFYLISGFYGIRIKNICTRHIKKTFINRVFFHHRCIFPADIHKRFGTFYIKPKIRLCKV